MVCYYHNMVLIYPQLTYKRDKNIFNRFPKGDSIILALMLMVKGIVYSNDIHVSNE